MTLIMANLEANFIAAKESGAQFVAVVVRMEGFPEDEIIINSRANFDSKLEYYKNTYDSYLRHKHAKGVSIVGFTYGDFFSDIERDLL